ncbi:MAG: hypothetical protein HC829_06920 [Bacteroidales bacterium]|nr:hypothetical protein [Bacteroidales bacterium]
MEFLEKYSFVKKMQRRCEILEQQLWRLLENGAADNRFDAVALAFDKANSRYKQALADALRPWVSCQKL